MGEILGIAEAVLYVDNLPQAVDFYQTVLDLPLTISFDDAAFLQTGPDSTLILFDRAQLNARQSAIPSHGTTGPGHVALAVPRAEMEHWRERLTEHDVEIEHEQHWPQGTFSLYFRDPAGNSVELIDSAHYPARWRQLAP